METTGNSTLETKDHNAQSCSPATTPCTSKKKRNIISQKTIQELLLHIKKLGKKVETHSGELNVTIRVNTLLSQNVDDLHQYQRRSCIIIDEINHDKDESSADITSRAETVLSKYLQISKEEIELQVDKCCRVGPKDEDETQATILKFKVILSTNRYTMRGKKSRNQNQDFP